jgi:hypothetical protein
VILRDLRVLAVLPTGTDSSLCNLRLPDDLPTGSFFGSGDDAGNRTQHARQTSPAMENATADRSGRSERCWEPWRLANGAVSGPGVCGRTTRMTGRRSWTPAIPRDRIRRSRPSDCSSLRFNAGLPRSGDRRPFNLRSSYRTEEAAAIIFRRGCGAGISGVRVDRWDDLVSAEEPHVSFGSDSAIGRRLHRKDAKSAKA